VTALITRFRQSGWSQLNLPRSANHVATLNVTLSPDVGGRRPNSLRTSHRDE